jgi:hypothetical protein
MVPGELSFPFAATKYVSAKASMAEDNSNKNRIEINFKILLFGLIGFNRCV